MIRFADPCHRIVAKNIARENAMNKLDNSRPFDIWIWSNKPEIRESTSFIYKKFFSYNKKFSPKKIRYHLRSILTDLFVVRNEDPQKYISISRSANKYMSLKRIRMLFLQYKYTMLILDTLEKHGYIEQHKGFLSEITSRETRIRATQKLMRLFRKYKSNAGKIFKRNFPIILRDDKKNEIDYDLDDLHIKKMISNINKINKMICSHHIELESQEIWDEIILTNHNLCNVLLNNKYRRIFNNSDFKNGGRFYCHWTQQIPSKYRKYIMIDGKETTEIDYSCLHLSMLYGIENIRLPQRDLYELDPISDKFRNIIKYAVNISINATTKDCATKALQQCYADNKLSSKIIGFKPKEIIDMVIERHHPIKKYFCTGYGLRLQAIESGIAEKIRVYFSLNEKCALCIHDSFITSSDNENILFKLMNDEFYKKFGFKPRVKIITK